MGRGVAIFSNSRAMAFASKIPTQIGRARFSSESFRMIIGMLVIGSRAMPRTVIWTNIAVLPLAQAA